MTTMMIMTACSTLFLHEINLFLRFVFFYKCLSCNNCIEASFILVGSGNMYKKRKMFVKHMRTNYQLSEYNAIYGKNAFFNIQFFTLKTYFSFSVFHSSLFLFFNLTFCFSFAYLFMYTFLYFLC